LKSMQLVDSHCHLDHLDAEATGSTADAIQAAEDQNVGWILNVCIDLSNREAVFSNAQTYSNVFASVGVHPNEKESEMPEFDQLVAWAQEPKVVAVGETGLDYHYHPQDTADWQRDRFAFQCQAAKAAQRPLIVHTRDAKDDTIEILRTEGGREAGGVLHCFTEDWEMAKKGLDLGFYVSFSGIVTFRTAETLREVARKVPADRILVETDAPWLAPVPHRGKPNRPAWVARVAECVAELKGVEVEVVHRQTSENFARLFPRAGLGV